MGGLKSEVQHLPPSKVRRCKAPRREDIVSPLLTRPLNKLFFI